MQSRKEGGIHTGMQEVCVESMLFGYSTLIPVHSWEKDSST